jgi:3-keto-5-aminohexanoate cleavage enzyme
MAADSDIADKLIIKLAPTGMIPTKTDTKYVPITHEEIAKDAYKAYQLEASVIHVHARDEQGRPTHKKE